MLNFGHRQPSDAAVQRLGTGKKAWFWVNRTFEVSCLSITRQALDNRSAQLVAKTKGQTDLVYLTHHSIRKGATAKQLEAYFKSLNSLSLCTKQVFMVTSTPAELGQLPAPFHSVVQEFAPDFGVRRLIQAVADPGSDAW